MTSSHQAEGIRTYGQEAEPTSSELPVGELASRLVEQTRRLARDEIELARVEAMQRAKRMGLGLGMFGGAGMVAFLGACCFVASAVLGLANVARPWFAAIIVGAACFIVAGLVALPGKRGFAAKHPAVPQETVHSLKADATAVREAVHHRG